jgi:DNA (cytosine-5)-methyltransferase 1
VAVAFAIQAGALRTNPASGPDGVGVQADHAYTLEARAEVQAVAFAENSRAEVQAVQHVSTENLAPDMGAKNPTAVAIGFQDDTTPKAREEGAFCLRRESGGEGACVMTPAMQVRRLTPTEAERLQGFPDGYTAIPWRKKPASECPDGPRYKALGNSWAVPVVRWIGERINAAVALQHGRQYLGCELNPEYLPLIEQRLALAHTPLFDTVPNSTAPDQEQA